MYYNGSEYTINNIQAAPAAAGNPPVKNINFTPYAVLVRDNTLLCDASAQDIVLILPSAQGLRGKDYTIKKVDTSTGSVIVLPNGSETIDLLSSLQFNTPQKSYTLRSDAANWKLI